MKIEEILKSSNYISDKHHRAYLNIIYSGIWLEEVTLSPLKCVGLTHPQYNVMRIVNGFKQSLPVASIQQRMLFKNSNVTRIVDKLVEKQLLTKTISKEDRRVVLVDITQEGKQLLADLYDKVYDLVRTIIGKNLQEDEAVLLGDLLDKMRA